MDLLQDWSPPDRFSLLFALALAAWTVAVRRLPRAPLILGATVFLSVLVVACCSLQFDLVGWHGFMHGAPMLRLLDGGPVPPEDPLFAGGTLRYPWVEHWLMARLAGATGLNPHLLTIGVELVAFAGLLASVAWMARLVVAEAEVVALAVLFGGFGVSIFHNGFLQQAVVRAFPTLSLETRIVPLDKFANITGMPWGYCAMVLSSATAVWLATGERRNARGFAVIAACTAVAAAIHPLSWVGILGFQGIAASVLLLSRRRDDLVRAMGIAVAVGLPSLVALPYLHAIGVSESSDGWTGITAPAGLWVNKLQDLALFLLPLATAAYTQRRRLQTMLDERNRGLGILLAVVAGMSAAYLCVRFPGRNEYKFLLFAMPSAAVIMAIAMRELLERQALLAWGLLVLMLVPGARILGTRPWFTVTDPVVRDGQYLRSIDPDADALYQWIARETPGDAVFVAADLRIPPFARRGLFIAVDAPWIGTDGWGLPRTQLLEWHIRRPDSVMFRRQQLATVVLDAAWESIPPAEVIAAIRQEVPGRPLYVHSQNPAAAARLDQTPGFTREFRNPAGSVYRIDAGGAR